MAAYVAERELVKKSRKSKIEYKRKKHGNALEICRKLESSRRHKSVKLRESMRAKAASTNVNITSSFFTIVGVRYTPYTTTGRAINEKKKRRRKSTIK